LSGAHAPWGGPFSPDALARSIAFDPFRALKGDEADALLAEIMALILKGQNQSSLSAIRDDLRLEVSAGALLANLLAAARNRVDPKCFVAVSFQRADYVSTPFSSKALGAVRDGFIAEALVEGQAGFRPMSKGKDPTGQARRTRLRATPKLLDIFSRFGVDRMQAIWRGRQDFVVMRSPSSGLGAEPFEVVRSRAILERTIERIAVSQVILPDEAWKRVVVRYRSELRAHDPRGEERVQAGDLTALHLYRVFKDDWRHGGRVYGGWWINLPKLERANLTILGDPVVELDYAQLHPTLLFARAGIELNFDPYEIPGLIGPHVRSLGKRTFNRLVNRTARSEGGCGLPLHPSAEDRDQLPDGVAFSSYLQRFVERLNPVCAWFGTGEGVRLQREDSDLALGILETLDVKDIPVLPVHDSFIVRRKDEGILREAMIDMFRRRYGFSPQIRSEQTS